MKIEPCNQDQLQALINVVGPIAAMVGGLSEADLSRGRGVLEGHDRCLWTEDGRRITISVSRDGIIISVGSEPDPEAPAQVTL